MKWVKSDQLTAWDLVKIGFVSTLCAVVVAGIVIWGFFL